MVLAWRKANPEKHRDHLRRANAKSGRRHHLKSRFGITVEQFDVLFATCNGICQICDQPERRAGRRLSLDHDHATGRLRGFICSRCNILLGLLRDDPEMLERAAAYLRTADLSSLLQSTTAEAGV